MNGDDSNGVTKVLRPDEPASSPGDEQERSEVVPTNVVGKRRRSSEALGSAATEPASGSGREQKARAKSRRLTDPPVLPENHIIMRRAGSSEEPCLKVLECIGQGGGGQVYSALHLRTNRIVCLKLVLPDGLMKEGSKAASPEDREFIRQQMLEVFGRFDNEAQAHARLGQHPGIVQVLDIHECEPPGLGISLPLLELEFVDGVTLQQLLDHVAGQQMPWLLAAYFAACVLDPCDWMWASGRDAIGVSDRELLEAAQPFGAVHRDVKPANLMISSAGWPKLLDFGLVWQGEGLRTYETKLDAGRGTYGYMPPEQGKSFVELDGRTDVYAVGVMLYEMLVGKHPVRGFANGLAAFQKIRITGEEVPRVPIAEAAQGVRDDLPEWLLRLADTMVHEVPEPRPFADSAREVLIERAGLNPYVFEPVLRKIVHSVRCGHPVDLSAVEEYLQARCAPVSPHASYGQPSSRKRAWLAAAAAGVLALVAAVFFFWPGSEPPKIVAELAEAGTAPSTAAGGNSIASQVAAVEPLSPAEGIPDAAPATAAAVADQAVSEAVASARATPLPARPPRADKGAAKTAAPSSVAEAADRPVSSAVPSPQAGPPAAATPDDAEAPASEAPDKKADAPVRMKRGTRRVAPRPRNRFTIQPASGAGPVKRFPAEPADVTLPYGNYRVCVVRKDRALPPIKCVIAAWNAQTHRQILRIKLPNNLHVQ